MLITETIESLNARAGFPCYVAFDGKRFEFTGRSAVLASGEVIVSGYWSRVETVPVIRHDGLYQSPTLAGQTFLSKEWEPMNNLSAKKFDRLTK